MLLLQPKERKKKKGITKLIPPFYSLLACFCNSKVGISLTQKVSKISSSISLCDLSEFCVVLRHDFISICSTNRFEGFAPERRNRRLSLLNPRWVSSWVYQFFFFFSWCNSELAKTLDRTAQNQGMMPMDNYCVPSTSTTGLVFPANSSMTASSGFQLTVNPPAGIKHEATLAVDWSVEEQYILEKGLAKYMFFLLLPPLFFFFFSWCFVAISQC